MTCSCMKMCIYNVYLYKEKNLVKFNPGNASYSNANIKWTLSINSINNVTRSKEKKFLLIKIKLKLNYFVAFNYVQ